jgi:hypothetical protein
MKTTELDSFARAYIEALFFTEAGPDGEFTTEHELAPEAIAKIKADCDKFQELAGELTSNGCTRSNEYSDWEMAGHDFWFTRNGHGVGFWDGDWPEVGDKLTAISKGFGEVWAYFGDDGFIYLSECDALSKRFELVLRDQSEGEPKDWIDRKVSAHPGLNDVRRCLAVLDGNAAQ